MARCEGTTKSGARCRRQAGADASFCVSHGAMRTGEAEPAVATEKPAKPAAGAAEKPASEAADEPSARATEKHPLANAAVVGLVALGLLALRRLLRLF